MSNENEAADNSDSGLSPQDVAEMGPALTDTVRSLTNFVTYLDKAERDAAHVFVRRLLGPTGYKGAAEYSSALASASVASKIVSLIDRLRIELREGTLSGLRVANKLVLRAFGDAVGSSPDSEPKVPDVKAPAGNEMGGEVIDESWARTDASRMFLRVAKGLAEYAASVHESERGTIRVRAHEMLHGERSECWVCESVGLMERLAAHIPYPDWPGARKAVARLLGIDLIGGRSVPHPHS